VFDRYKLPVPSIAIVTAVIAFLSDLYNSITNPTVSICEIKLGASYQFMRLYEGYLTISHTSSP